MQKKNSKVEENKKWEGFWERNKKNIMFFVGGVVVGGLIMGIMWPDRIAKLSDGTEVVAEINEKNFTADDVYNKLKEGNGLTALLQLVDLEILKEKYDLDEEANNYAKEQSEYIYNMYQSAYGYTKESFLEENGFSDESEFLSYLQEEYYYQQYYNDYLASKITDKEAEEYYKDEVMGAKYVYVFSSNEKDNDLSKVKKALDSGSSYKDITNKYQDITANDLGVIEYDTYSNYSTEFLTNLKKIDKPGTSSVFEDSSYGNALIYVSEVNEKEDYKDIKDGIKKVLATKLGNEDDSLYYKAYIELRDAYNLKIYDTKIQALYDDFKKQHK